MTKIISVVARQLEPTSADQLSRRTSVAFDQRKQPANPLLLGRIPTLLAGHLRLGHVDKQQHIASRRGLRTKEGLPSEDEVPRLGFKIIRDWGLPRDPYAVTAIGGKCWFR
jgi:hypothetical protein